MKSSIKIDYIDRGTGKSLEPVIRVEIINSEDPRDKLISHLFQSVSGENFLQFVYSHHKPVSTVEGLPDYEKQVLIFKSEGEVVEPIGYRVLDNCTAFHDFLKEQEIEFTCEEHYTIVKDTKFGPFLLGQKLQAHKVAVQSQS